MFPSRFTTIKILLVLPLLLLILCLESPGVASSTIGRLHAATDNVEDDASPARGPWVASRSTWTMEALEEEDEAASLTELIAEAAKLRSGSRKQTHSTLSRSPADFVTPTQLTFLDLAHLYLPALTNVSKHCHRDLIAIYKAMAQLGELVKDGILWPLKLVDSWGKFADGLLIGNMKQLGFFKECLDIRVFQPSENMNLPPLPQNFQSQPLREPVRSQHLPPDLQDRLKLAHPPLFQRSQLFKGQQDPPRLLISPQVSSDLKDPKNTHPWAINFPLQPHSLYQHPRSSLDEDADLFNDLLDSLATSESPPSSPSADFSGQYCLVTYARDKKELEAPPVNVRTPALSAVLPVVLDLIAYGTCIPSTCTREELQDTVNAALQEEGLSVATIDCQVKDQQRPLSGSEITGIVIIALLVFFLVLGTLADLVTSVQSRQHLQKGPLKYLLAFSVTTNLQKMFHLETRKLPGVIPSVNGIRFISITWVVLGHQYAYSATMSQNIGDLPQISKPVYMQIVSNADKSVDTFFLLSGLLVTLGLLEMVNRTRHLNLPFYLMHRLLRLWPPVALSTMLVATVAGLVVTGPYSDQYWNSVVKGCRRSWWSDVTFLNNLVYPYLDRFPKDEGEAASCLPHTWYLGVDTQLYLIMPLLLLPLIWWPRRGWAWLLLWTAASIIIPAAITGAYHLWPTSLLVLDQQASLEFNHKVYMMPWCRAGPYLVGAWVGYLFHYSKKNPSITSLRPWHVCVGWAAAAGVALAVLLGIAPYNYVGTPKVMSTAEAVLYGGVHRAAWGVGVAWVIVACTWGYGGPVAWILEHPLWQPFSRLSYCVYLTSLPLQFMILYSTKRPAYYSIYGKLQETAGVLVVTVAVSIFVSLASESPVLRLEKLLLHRHSEAARSRVAPEVAAPPVLGESGPDNDPHAISPNKQPSTPAKSDLDGPC